MFQTVVTCKRRTTSSCLVLRGRVRRQPRIFTRRHSFLIEKQIITPTNRRMDQNQHNSGQHRSWFDAVLGAWDVLEINRRRWMRRRWNGAVVRHFRSRVSLRLLEKEKKRFIAESPYRLLGNGAGINVICRLILIKVDNHIQTNS